MAGVSSPPSRRASSPPGIPASWYLFGASKDFGPRPVAKELFGRRWTHFRTSSGKVAVLASQCAHMAADLSAGRVEGETVVCPYHGWAYARDGACVHVPGQAANDIPRFARVASLPVEERFGHVFVFAGEGPSFPFPSFPGLEDLRAARRMPFRAESPYYLVCGNAFDFSHLTPVHGRALLDRARIDEPAPFARRVRYTSAVIGRKLADRCVRLFAGPRVSISITIWAGTLAFVEARFARTTSRILLSVVPEGPEACSLDVLALRPASDQLFDRVVVEPLSLAVRRSLTRSFLAGEIQELSGARFDRERTTAHDAELSAYVDWLATLPEARFEGPFQPQVPSGGRS